MGCELSMAQHLHLSKKKEKEKKNQKSVVNSSNVNGVGHDYIQLKTCFNVLYMHEKTSVCEKIPAGPACNNRLKTFVLIHISRDEEIQIEATIKYLCNKDATLIEPGLDD